MLCEIKRGAIVMAVLLFVSGCASGEKGSRELTSESLKEDLEIAVQVGNEQEEEQFELYEVVFMDMEQSVDSKVSLEYPNSVMVYPPRQGNLREYYVADGEAVKEGDIICVIDYDTSASKNRLELLELQFAYDKKKAEENEASWNVRIDEFKKDMATETDSYNRRINEYRLRKMELDKESAIISSNNALRRTEEEIERLKDETDGLEVYSPSDGVVRLLGNYEGKNIDTGYAIVEIVVDAKAVPVTLTSVNNMRYGATYTIHDESGNEYEVTVINRPPDIIRVPRDEWTFYLQLKDSNVDLEALMERNPKVGLSVFKVHDVIAVPAKAIRTEADTSYVNIYDDGVIKKRYVDTGLRTGGFVQITDGLDAGQTVIVY